MEALQADALPQFTRLAYERAGIRPESWQPELGYRANRVILDKLYYYYQQLFNRCPERFLWAGLARLTGGQVLYGMDHLVRIARDPCALTVGITGVAKAIFERMAPLHELYLNDPGLLHAVCRTIDAEANPSYAYSDCWQKVQSGDAEGISEGNKILLRNEQLNTIQVYYDRIWADGYSARYFSFTRFVMRNIHPYHRRFIFCYPLRDVTRFPDRWSWIEGKNGMWATWAGCGEKERYRLVNLSNEAIIRHRWNS